jgi:hypothetical protein
MNTKIIFRTALTLAVATTLFTSCKKNDPPVPDEQELITTVKVTLTNTSTGFNKTFQYKIENGFNNSTPGTIQIDTVQLPAGQSFSASMTVLNEKADPVENTTEEIQEKDYEHLFLYQSDPATGAGSIVASDGNKDENGKPFNLTTTWTTGTAGKGTMSIHLMHLPVNKDGTTPETAGGETDLFVVFPTVIN